jgi:hypothetical protein
LWQQREFRPARRRNLDHRGADGPRHHRLARRKDKGEPQRYTLSCPEPSGEHPDPEKACEAVYDLNTEDFEPVSPDAICTEIYGGPERARLEGTFAGGDDVVPVALDLSRENGCQIDLWDRFAKIVPQPAGS